MNTPLSPAPRGLLAAAFLALALTGPALRADPTVAKPQVNAPVTLTDNGANWTLANGIVQATINKRDGRMTALMFHGINTMGGSGGGRSANR